MATVDSTSRATGLTTQDQVAVLRDLRGRDLVRSEPFLPEQGGHAFYLSPFGARILNLPRSAARPFGIQGLVERWAVLWFSCLEAGKQRLVFNPSNEREQFPQLAGQRLPQPYFFFDREDGTSLTLGYLLIDPGGALFVRRTLPKKLKRLATLFEEWMKDGSFRITVLTVTARREKELLRVLPAFFGKLPFRVVVVPGMAELTLGRASSRGGRP